jgi:putative polyhydroxyalkanoate system protein
MADINLKRKHTLGLKKAKVAAQKVADDLAEHFDVKSEWDGNELRFSRSGVNGVLEVSKDSVEVNAKLGMLLSAFKPKIEEQIGKNFDKYFG